MTQSQGKCLTPMDIPGKQCWELNESECGYDDDCILASAYVEPDPAGDDDGGPPDCILDCAFPSTLNSENGNDMCTWVTTSLYTTSSSGAYPQACISDCATEVQTEIQSLAFQCQACLSAVSSGTNPNACDQVWAEESEEVDIYISSTGGGGIKSFVVILKIRPRDNSLFTDL